MHITLVYIGKDKFSFLKEGVATFQKRLRKYCNFSLVEITDVKGAAKLSKQELKKKEAEKILAKITKKTFLILLDENGKNLNSIQFASSIEKLQVSGVSDITFVIGGAYGFSESLYQKANVKIALSPMTFSHQLIRLIFIEQLYRVFTILNNEPYHNA